MSFYIVRFLHEKERGLAAVVPTNWVVGGVPAFGHDIEVEWRERGMEKGDFSRQNRIPRYIY